MKIVQLDVEFVLHGCRSLKDKRRRLKKLKDKFGRSSSVAVCESAYPDDLRRSGWSFIACAASATVVEQALSDIERYVEWSVDAEVISFKRSWLG